MNASPQKDSTVTVGKISKPPPIVKRRHKWSDPIRVFGDHTSTGCEQSERECGHCGLIKITVHPPQGFPWREWRARGSGIQYVCDFTPECVPEGEVKAM